MLLRKSLVAVNCVGVGGPLKDNSANSVMSATSGLNTSTLYSLISNKQTLKSLTAFLLLHRNTLWGR